MKKCMAIGEAIIDFIPETKGRAIKDVEGFQPKAGGAPANVCGAFARLGGRAGLITMVGEDSFGDKLIEEFDRYGIDCTSVLRTKQAGTSLAFVALREDGNREFLFYRKPGADMLLEADQIRREWFADAYVLHFGSVSLGDFPMREAHDRAIAYAKESGALISFDPNVRLALWENKEKLRTVILEYAKRADILKISDEELEFITQTSDIQEALPQLLTNKTKLVVYTKGMMGAECFTKNGRASVDGIPCQAQDTTGAGDGFIGAFLYALAKDGVQGNELEGLPVEQMRSYLHFANGFCAYSVQRSGAIASYPKLGEFERRISSLRL